MFDRDFMPCAHHAALEQRERRFDRIGRNAQPAFVPDVFIGLVIDALVFHLVIHGRSEVVELRFVRHDHVHSLVHVSGDDLVNLVLIQVRGRDEVKVSATLTDAHDGRVLLPLVRVLGMASDVHLVNFNCALEFVVRFFHSFADAMAEVPRRLVRDAKHSFDLIRGDALARFRNQVGHKKPLRQRQMRVVEDRSYGRGELIMA